jgi:hypothetical protein
MSAVKFLINFKIDKMEFFSKTHQVLYLNFKIANFPQSWIGRLKMIPVNEKSEHDLPAEAERGVLPKVLDITRVWIANFVQKDCGEPLFSDDSTERHLSSCGTAQWVGGRRG